MTNDPKAEGQADKTGGKLKEGAGKLTGDQSLENEGKADQSKGSLKKAFGNIKNAFKK